MEHVTVGWLVFDITDSAFLALDGSSTLGEMDINLRPDFFSLRQYILGDFPILL